MIKQMPFLLECFLSLSLFILSNTKANIFLFHKLCLRCEKTETVEAFTIEKLSKKLVFFVRFNHMHVFDTKPCWWTIKHAVLHSECIWNSFQFPFSFSLLKINTFLLVTWSNFGFVTLKQRWHWILMPCKQQNTCFFDSTCARQLLAYKGKKYQQLFCVRVQKWLQFGVNSMSMLQLATNYIWVVYKKIH